MSIFSAVPKERMVCAAAIVAIAISLIVLGCVVSTLETTHSNENQKSRVYYLAAVEEEWDYLPRRTKILEKRSRYADRYDKPIGNSTHKATVYKKALFREYTDSSYTTRLPHDKLLGVLGPVLKAEVGDTLEIHLFNNASHPVSLHAHAAFYEKDHEGAFYSDKTENKNDDKVFPGDTYTYIWTVPPSRGPTESDPTCMSFAYHSHVTGDTDIHTGLIGPLIICKPGGLRGELTSYVGNNEFVLLFMIFDENESWYAEENMNATFASLPEAEAMALRSDEAFAASHRMYSINGYMYDTLEGLETCLGSRVKWHLMAMGNEADIHAVTFAGHSVVVNGHRTDTVHLFPAKFTTALMNIRRPGTWPIRSEVGDHYLAGMEASFSVERCHGNELTSESVMNSKIRKYFVAAEELWWNYAPSGKNLFTNTSLTFSEESQEYFAHTENRIGGTYKKVLYVEYEDEEFQIRKPVPSSHGFLGPTIRAEVGETLEITFLNRANRTYSLQSTAFLCEGCSYGNNGVEPGQNKSFKFFISEDLSPTDSDPLCLTWRYFSDVDSLKDSYSGLNGALLTCRKGTLDDKGHQKFVSREYPLMFAVMDENESHYIEQNIEEYLNASAVEREDPDFVESNLMHSVNGLMYGNLLNLEMCLYQNISWHLLAIGHEVDLHVVHFFGNAFSHQGFHRNTLALFPGSHTTVIMQPQAQGEYRIECHTNDHIRGGMKTSYTVQNCDGDSYRNTQISESGKQRIYYIAAVEEEWNYAPSRIHPITGEDLWHNEHSKVFVKSDDVRIGSKYLKVLYREYTNSSFVSQKRRTENQEHLGFLGPIVKGEVGDTVRIVFFNNASREYNFALHGTFFQAVHTQPSSNDSTPVKPGQTVTYEWKIIPTAGPSENEFNCTNFIYYSSTDSIKDTNSGLVGPFVVCRKGVLNDDDSRNDVEKEFAVLFTVMDENESWYLDDNIQKYCTTPRDVDVEDEDFKESNLKHSINGRLYATLPGLSGSIGDRVAWYLMGLGTEIDLHTAHFHGLTVIEKSDASKIDGRREDVVDLFPGVFRTVEMVLDSPGTWLFHCHVDDHLKAGMFALVNVHKKSY